MKSCLPKGIGLLACALLTVACYSSRADDKPDPAGVAFFESKIRPVLIEHCYSCHSTEAKKQKGGLLLDTRAGVLKGGDSGPALVAGKAKDSLLIKALHQDDGLKMPPKAKLPPTVIADLEKWVAMGAPDPRDGTATSKKRFIDIDGGKRYWAFAPLQRGDLPAVKDAVWGKTAVDRFILNALEAKGLTPNPITSKEKLVRRAYYDLWGLPPTPAEIDAFVSDTTPDAYPKLIDRLLQSERHGERWARHWLDAVRFAESGGYEFDGDRPGAFHYRDFVIKAFNQDMPFDQFVRLQPLAGDQMAPGEYHATSATGFLVAGPYPGQTTAKTLEIIRYDHLDDMISTVGTSMLGLSLGCARCHEHKYDPIPQEDYYRLIAALAKTDSTTAKLDPNPEIYRQAKAAFDTAHAPFVAAVAKFEKEELANRVQKWAAANKDAPTPTWQYLELIASSGKTPVEKRDDASLVAGSKAAKTDVYVFNYHTFQKNITAVRLEALSDPSLPKAGPGRGPDGNFLLTGFEVTATPLVANKGKAAPVKLRADWATAEANPLAGALDADKKTGWSVAGAAGRDHLAIFETEGEVGFDGGTLLTVTLKFEGDGFPIGRPRLAISTEERPVKIEGLAAHQGARELLAVLAANNGEVNDGNRRRVVQWFRTIEAEANQVYRAQEQHAAQEPKPKLVDTFVAADKGGRPVHFLIRGEVERKNGQPHPGFIQVLMTSAERDGRWATKATEKEPRQGIAHWMTDAEQGAGHLLARVIVNRLWQHHMGRGIVGTPNDFGVQGDPPTHPELLDYLAGELIRNGWMLKPLHKLIMTSAVYMQGGDTNDTALKVDPANRLWWRRPARRLEAEAIRDGLLAVSATLDSTMYGPGTLDENTPRRSVYLTVKRSRLVPMLQMYDAPEAIQSIGARSTTTVATQALAMMNSPFVRQRADKFAQRIKPKTVDGILQAIEDAYRTALGRRPVDGERERMTSFVQQQMESYGNNAKALDLALTDFCQVLLCLNEFVYVD